MIIKSTEISYNLEKGYFEVNGRRYHARDVSNEKLSENAKTTVLEITVGEDNIIIESDPKPMFPSLFGYGKIWRQITEFDKNFSALKEASFKNITHETSIINESTHQVETIRESEDNRRTGDSGIHIDVEVIGGKIDDFGVYPVKKLPYDVVPFVYFKRNATGQIFTELVDLCKSVSSIPVELSNQRGWYTANEDVPVIAYITPHDYYEYPRLISKKDFKLNQNGTLAEDIGDYVERVFCIVFFSQHDVSEYPLKDPLEAEKAFLRQCIKENLIKYVDEINSRYLCVSTPKFISPEEVTAYGNTHSGKISASICKAFTVIYPASLEPSPQVLGKPNKKHPYVDYENLVKDLAKSITLKSADLGIVDEVCPYCNGKLKKFPQKKTLCPSCRKPIYPRKRYRDNAMVLLTEEELAIYDSEKMYQLNGGVDGRAKQLINFLSVNQASSDRWLFSGKYAQNPTESAEIEKFGDSIVMVGSPEEKEAISLLLQPEYMVYNAEMDRRFNEYV